MRSCCRLALFVALALTVAFGASPALAHGMRTAYLEVVEDAPGAAIVTFKTTVADPLTIPRFPDGCAAELSGDAAAAHTQSFLLHCDGPLAGRTFGVTGLGPILTEAVLRVSLHDGESVSTVLTQERSSFLIPRRESRLATLKAYVGLGIVHIAGGPDHLLFLLALVLYLRRPRAIFVAETAFTLSHSLSFSATALGLIRVSSAAAEACIALSLVLLAGQVARRRAAPPTAAAGAVAALIFGLVHGLGFAGGLSEIGVPDGAAALALAGFGLGVELGQVAFLAAVLVVMAGLTRLVPPARLGLLGGYLVGAAGSFWLIERLRVCFT